MWSHHLSVVCNLRAPYSGDLYFPQCFYAIWYDGHLLTSAVSSPDEFLVKHSVQQSLSMTYDVQPVNTGLNTGVNMKVNNELNPFFSSEPVPL